MKKNNIIKVDFRKKARKKDLFPRKSWILIVLALYVLGQLWIFSKVF